jgi:hypothetical protein
VNINILLNHIKSCVFSGFFSIIIFINNCYSFFTILNCLKIRRNGYKSCRKIEFIKITCVLVLYCKYMAMKKMLKMKFLIH